MSLNTQWSIGNHSLSAHAHVCVSGMRLTSTSTEQCLSWTVLYARTRFSDTRPRRHRRRQSPSHEDDDSNKPVTVQPLPKQHQMTFIILLFVASVTQKSEFMTVTKSIISSMFLQAMLSLKWPTAANIAGVFKFWYWQLLLTWSSFSFTDFSVYK